jgi:hypothetical protein
MTTLPHLTPEVAEALEYDQAQRIAFCQTDRWIEYTRAREVLRQLSDVLSHPKSLRMRNLLVVGRSGNGKSSILEHFTNRHPVIMTPGGDPVATIVRIEMPETPDESEFWSLILWALKVTHRERDSAAVKKRQAKSILQYAQIRLLVIDEFNNLVNAGKMAAYLLAAIKGLSNDLKISIVAAGTQAAINALNSDPQMKSRFDPCALNRWSLNAEYLRFLASYERVLPLKQPSGLASRELATAIYGMGGEVIGNTVRVLKAAARKAIESGQERITLDTLQAIDWTKPGDWDTVARTI